MPRSSYDAIVLGRELVGAVAGALLCQRGLRVLMISDADDPTSPSPQPGQPPPAQDRYTLGPYVLPTSPMAFVGAEAPAIRKIVGDLNLVQLFRRRIEPNRPAFQLLLPDARVDVDDDLYHALEREAPGAGAAYEHACARSDEVSRALDAILQEEVMLPPDGFWDRRDGKRVAARLPPDDEPDGEDAPPPSGDTGAALVHGLSALPACFATDLATPGVVARARAGDLWRRGTFRIDGGREGLRALFLERMRALGGEHRPELRAERVVVRRGRVVAVDTGAGEGEVGCEHLVAATRADQLLRLLGDERPTKRLAEAAALRPALHRYLLHLVVPLDVLPDALARVSFAVRDPTAPLVGDNALRLHLQDGYGQHAVLTAEALAPDPTPDAIARLRRDVRAHLDALLPFVARHALCVHSPNDGVPPDGVSEAAPPPRPMDPLWEIPAPRLLGVCGVGYDVGYKGLVLGGRQSLPGLGTEGELEAALRVTRLVAGASRRREPQATISS